MILIDNREKVPPPLLTKNWLTKRDIPAKVTKLDVGDFQFEDANGGMVLVTRKATDLFDSLYSGHLSEELSAMVKAVTQYGKGSVWFMLDGIFVGTKSGNIGVYTTTGSSEWLRLKNERVGEPSMISGLAASLWASGIGFLPTTYPPATLKSLWERAEKVNDKGEWPSSVARGVEKPTLKWHENDSKVARLMALWPRLAERPAAQLIQDFGSIREIVRIAGVDDKKLLSIPGIGKVGLNNFKETLS